MEDRKHFNPDDFLDRAVDSVLRSPIPDELPADRVAQLVAVVRQAADQSYPITLIERIKNMKPITRIAVAASVLIAFFGLMSWLVPGSGAALAFDDVAEALKNVQSARWKTTKVTKGPQGRAETRQEIGMFMAPSSERTETNVLGVPSARSIMICKGRKALFLSPPLKQATLLDVKMNIEGLPGPFGRTFLGLRQSVVGAQSGKMKGLESLGTKVIDGRHAVGFRIQDGPFETKIWADPKTSLPIRVERATSGEIEIHTVMTDFEIDPDLDKSLFSLDVPEGYTVNKVQLDLPKNPIVFLAKVLGMAAELNGGVFPTALRGEQGLFQTLPRLGPTYLEKKYGKDLAAHAYIFGRHPAEKLEPGGDKSDILKKLSEMRKEATQIPAAVAGTFAILRQLSPEKDWHYAGKDVKLNAPNRPIFWIKAWGPRKARKDGKYDVIYADLSVKEVATEELKGFPETSAPK